MFSYIIEHMEDDEPSSASSSTLPEWVSLEYRHMRSLAGPDAQVHFTALSSSSAAALVDVFASPDACPTHDDHPRIDPEHRLKKLASAEAHREGVLEFTKQRGIPLERICLLDPKAEKELSPEDGHDVFDCFLFGGILGDDPPRDRTGELRKLGFPSRHLGTVQMTTDTALGVTKRVVDDKIKLGDIPYVDFPTITFNSKESVEMPFRYMSSNDQPLLPPGMRELLHRDLDKGFEF